MQYIRNLLYQDYEQFIVLRQQLGGYIIMLSQSQWWERYLQMEREGSVIYVLTEGEKILATCKLIIERKFSNPVGHIEDVVVNADYRGRGIGVKVVKYAIDQAKLAGCYKIVLGCKDDLQHFYEKCGMIREGFEMIMRIA